MLLAPAPAGEGELLLSPAFGPNNAARYSYLNEMEIRATFMDLRCYDGRE